MCTELFHVEGEAPRVAVAPDAMPGDVTPSDVAVSTVVITLDGRVSTVTTPRAPDTSRDGSPHGAQLTGVPGRILDAVLAVRADAPYACRGGVCGTCRAKVIAGEVVMERNYALDPEEVLAGFVLACQSVPVSAEAELDFDA